MTAPRAYVVGDRVVIVGLPKLRPDTGTVVKVRQDPLPYLVDLGAPWTPSWWSGIDLEPAPEIFAVDPVLTAVREEARKAKVDGDFATVEEHVAAWKRGGRRWARVAGFNVDAMRADDEAERGEQERLDAVAAMLAADPVQAARCGVPVEIEGASVEELRAANVALVARLERVGALALGHDDGACPTCGAVRR